MTKAKRSSKREKSSKNKPRLRLKKGIKLSKHDPFKALVDEKLIAQALWECLKENDLEGAIEITNAHLKALAAAEA